MPDYSCCYPELLVPEEERLAYWEAHCQEDHITLNKLTYAYLARKLALKVKEDARGLPSML